MRKRTQFGKATSCPCGKSKKFSPIIEDGRPTDGGKCFSPHCDQRFFPPTRSNDRIQLSLPSPSHHREHIYTTGHGEPYMRVVVRREDDGSKRVFQQRWDNQQWVNGLDGIEPLPYRLPELLERVALDGVVVIFEGEKDVDRACTIGLTATTNPMGAGKWASSLSPYFEGARVVVIPDNDDVGNRHAEQVKQSLQEHGVRFVAVLDLKTLMPSLPPKGDLSDFLDLGGDPEVLRQTIDELVREDSTHVETAVLPAPIIADDSLPASLQGLLAGLSDPYHRVSLLMSAIAVIGSVMPRVTFRYGNRDLAPTLYLLVIGPPGSGKSSILPAALLVDRILNELQDEHRRALKAYRQLEAQRRSDSTEHSHDHVDPPVRPLFLVPGDSTAPVIVRALCQNPGILVFDTEADSFNTAMRSDTGDASSALRKAWGGEPISHARAGGDLFLATSHPRLSMVLSGTLDQVQSLVHHAANGLLSRFAFIEIARQRRFRDPFSAEGFPSEHAARDLQSHVYDLWRANAQRDVNNGFRVELTTSQRQRFLEHYRDRYDADILESDEAVTLRSGINVVRIVTILTALRVWDEANHLTSIMIARDDDFELALTIGEYLRQGTDKVAAGFESLRSSAVLRPRKRKISMWIESLPTEFKTNEALTLAKKHGIGRSQTFDNLGNDRWFVRVRHGTWRKVI